MLATYTTMSRPRAAPRFWLGSPGARRIRTSPTIVDRHQGPRGARASSLRGMRERRSPMARSGRGTHACRSLRVRPSGRFPVHSASSGPTRGRCAPSRRRGKITDGQFKDHPTRISTGASRSSRSVSTSISDRARALGLTRRMSALKRCRHLWERAHRRRNTGRHRETLDVVATRDSLRTARARRLAP